MRYRIAAVGKLRRGFYASACDFYLKRLQAFGRAEVVEVKEGRGAAAEQVRRAEADSLLQAVEGRLIALDERGRGFTSRELAGRLSDLEIAGESSMTVVVGGADGLHRRVREAAQETWSLSPLTMPHELARLVLLEQLYRAETIRAGHPYHRD
ncbi:MAG TPA: 23S rRNA (pseudouridine(1915)-N(3))-methyltransferase RlmH [Trueperaceae bacterium]